VADRGARYFLFFRLKDPLSRLFRHFPTWDSRRRNEARRHRGKIEAAREERTRRGEAPDPEAGAEDSDRYSCDGFKI